MNTYTGIPVSSGIGIGEVCLIENKEITIPCYKISSTEKQLGWEKFEKARNDSINLLTEQLANCDKEQAEIFQTHLMMLSDPEFIKEVKSVYDAGEYNIEYILDNKIKEFSERLKASGNDYLIERAEDIIDAYDRVFRLLQGIVFRSIDTIQAGCVVVAESLKPSDALAISKKSVSAIVTHEGGTTSHLAILARSYGIPYVSGVADVISSLKDGTLLIVDGNTGVAISSPDEITENEYRRKLLEETAQKKKLKQLTKKRAETKDGKQVELFANISNPEEAELAYKSGADGIGLFRTEFFFMNRKKLSEEEQYEAYSKVLKDMKGKPVVIRTIDAGGDKVLKGDDFSALEAETDVEKNPLLGWRAVRFCLDNTAVFKTQLKALLRAGVNSKGAAGSTNSLRILIPMISGTEELEKTLSLINEAKKELAAENKEYADDILVGIMVEIPAAAVTADDLAQKCKFFSIGTNDLTQYTICVDRENAKVATLYNEFHPAVIQLIKNTVEAAFRANIPVSVCGELAGKQEGAFLLYGLGVRKFSASISVLNGLKEMFSLFTEEEIYEVVSKAVSFRNAAKTEEYIANTLKARM